MYPYICPRCENYTYDCTKPCSKCGFDFEDSKKIVVTVNNHLEHLLFYDFSYGAGLCVKSNTSKTLKIREYIMLRFFFNTYDEHNNCTIHSVEFNTKNEKRVELDFIEKNGKYRLLQKFVHKKKTTMFTSTTFLVPYYTN